MASAIRSSVDNVVKVDPMRNRPANADESAPEALVPDVARTRCSSATLRRAMERRIVGNAFRNALMNSHSCAGLPRAQS